MRTPKYIFNTLMLITAIVMIRGEAALAQDAAALPISISLDAGLSLINFSGGFKNIFEPNDISAPANFGVASGSGLHVALRAVSKLSPWISVGAGIRFVQVKATYNSASSPYPYGDPSTGPIDDTSYSFTTSITINELSFDPVILFFPFGGAMFLEVGGSVGVVIGQSGNYSHVTTGNNPVNISMSSTSLGAATPQWAVLAGVGGAMPVGERFGVDLAVRARVALNPIFSNNYPKVAFSADPTIGISYRVQ